MKIRGHLLILPLSGKVRIDVTGILGGRVNPYGTIGSSSVFFSNVQTTRVLKMQKKIFNKMEFSERGFRSELFHKPHKAGITFYFNLFF